MWNPGSLSDALMRRRTGKRGAAPRWRRGSWPIPGKPGIGWWSAGRRRPGLTRGGGLTSLRAGRSQGLPKGGLANPLAPPGAPSPLRRGKEKGKRRARAAKNRAGGAMRSGTAASVGAATGVWLRSSDGALRAPAGKTKQTKGNLHDHHIANVTGCRRNRLRSSSGMGAAA
jgi:hypothetical protein